MPNTYEPGLTSQPDAFGVSVDADGRVVVDDFNAVISNIPAVVRAFTADNRGYWIEDVFNSPGWTVQGGAVKYTISAVGDYFLPTGQLMPRAPGAEAPRISGTRQRPVVAYPESVSGSIEVTDEARQRNDMIQLRTTLQQASNTFANTFQSLGEAALDALVTTSSRFAVNGAGTFSDWAASPREANTNSNGPFPAEEFDFVQQKFIEELGGVLPDTIVWTPADRRQFFRVYRGEAREVLAAAGLTRELMSVRRQSGRRLYLKSGQVGTMAWEKPMGEPEYTREGTRFTDVYSMEGRVVFVANGADAIFEMRTA